MKVDGIACPNYDLAFAEVPFEIYSERMQGILFSGKEIILGDLSVAVQIVVCPASMLWTVFVLASIGFFDSGFDLHYLITSCTLSKLSCHPRRRLRGTGIGSPTSGPL